MDNNYKTESLSFDTIVLSYLRKIMDINLKLVTPDSKIDHLHSYRDCVLTLSDVLLPFYDDTMNNAYAKYQKEYEEAINLSTSNGCINNLPIYSQRIKQVHRELFRQLNLLLKRNDYLKSSVYGEGDDETVDEGVETDE